MNKQLLELAQRAVACDHWRWMEGMKVSNIFIPDQRAVEAVSGAPVIVFPGGERARLPPETGALPDLSDPATLGCLLHLVREAFDLFGVSTHYVFDPPTMCWQVRNPVEVYAYAATELELGFTEEQAKKASKLLEIEALINALEAAND